MSILTVSVRQHRDESTKAAVRHFFDVGSTSEIRTTRTEFTPRYNAQTDSGHKYFYIKIFTNYAKQTNAKGLFVLHTCVQNY